MIKPGTVKFSVNGVDLVEGVDFRYDYETDTLTLLRKFPEPASAPSNPVTGEPYFVQDSMMKLAEHYGDKPLEELPVDCKTCVHTYEQRGQGECWTECSHSDHGRDAYQNILWGCQAQPLDKPPSWCPILHPKK
jgi:hypothetical protein